MCLKNDVTQCGGRIRQARIELPYIPRKLSLSYHLTTPTYLRSHSFHAIALPRQIAKDAKKKTTLHIVSEPNTPMNFLRYPQAPRLQPKKSCLRNLEPCTYLHSHFLHAISLPLNRTYKKYTLCLLYAYDQTNIT